MIRKSLRSSQSCGLCEILVRNGTITKKHKSAVLRETKKRTGYYLASGNYSINGAPGFRVSREAIADALREQFPGEEIMPLEFSTEVFRLAARYSSKELVECDILIIEKDDQTRRIKFGCTFPLKTKGEKLSRLCKEARKLVDSCVPTEIPYELQSVLVPQFAVWDYHKRIRKERLWKQEIFSKRV